MSSNTSQESAENFVNFLLEEGIKIPCDDTLPTFNRNALPSYYNEKLFKRGQQLFHKNIFAMFFAKLLGLLSGISIPSMTQILLKTQRSSTPLSAYKRYLSTLSHMCIWYESNFYPGSRLWQSINYVKNRHTSASKYCCNSGLQQGITQRDMALTQFGFMGIALTQQKKVGLHNISDDDWKAFIHLWRVIGYIMGMEDRFNICRESVEETKLICNLLIEKVVIPEIEKKDEDFLMLSRNLMDGMWVMNPVLHTRVFLSYYYYLLNPIKNQFYFDLNFLEKCLFYFIVFVIWSLQFSVYRISYNLCQYSALWLMRVFPFLAYYKYGVNDAHVAILPEHVHSK